MRSKKTRIVTESSTTSLLIMKNSSGEFRRGWCEVCGTDVIWVETETLKSMASPDNLSGHGTDTLVCLRSVMEGRNSIYG